jgi:hypothetical protein
MLSFIIGCIVGGCATTLLMSILFIAKDADLRAESFRTIESANQN